MFNNAIWVYCVGSHILLATYSAVVLVCEGYNPGRISCTTAVITHNHNVGAEQEFL